MTMRALALALPPLIGLVGTHAAADPSRLEDIARAYARASDSLRNIRADYHIEESPAMEKERLYKLFGIYELTPSDSTVVVASDGRIYRQLRSRRHNMADIEEWLQKRGRLPDGENRGPIPLAEIEAALPESELTTFEVLEIFDGKRLVAKSPNKLARLGVPHSTFQVIYIPRLESPYFPETPLDYCLYAFPVPGMPRDDEFRRKHRPSALFSDVAFAIAGEAETIGEDECIVLRAPGHQNLWLVPGKNYAVRRREFFFGGVRILDLECGDYRPLIDDAWLAGEVTITYYGGKGMGPAECEGLPIRRSTYRLTNLMVNSPANEKYFQVELAAGDVVVDETLVEDAKKGRVDLRDGQEVRTSIAYSVPAVQGDLDRVIADALREERERGQPKPWWSRLRHPLVWVNLGIVVVFGGIALARRRRGVQRPT